MRSLCIWLTVLWIVNIQVNLVSAFPIHTPEKSQLPASSSTADGIDATYFWPLAGLTLDTNLPWGLNVSVLTGGSESFQSIYQVFIGGVPLNSSAGAERPSSTSSTHQPQVTAVSSVLQQDNGEISAINIINDGTPQIILGPNATYPDTNTSASVQTIPFGINLGQAGTWNGSLTLSGTFDVNRIASTKWMRLPISGDFFASGEQDSLPGSIRLTSSSTDTQFELDLNSDAIILPASENASDDGSSPACGEDMTIIMNGGDTTILLPGNVTNSPSRCYTRDSSDPLAKTTTLGRPFLQAAYAYFDQDGSVWVTQANQYDLPVNPQPFDSSAALVPPPPPTAWKLAHPDWHNYLKTGSGISQYIACLAGFGFLMFVFVSLCNGILL
ncbi:MAG: hypothetical protein M1821_005771 [Bathelium mastoideum]|nr:MAG: hypothetical protein M1821_005771 [Bathelium mastoideum]